MRQVGIAAGLVAILSGAALVTRQVVATRLQAARGDVATVVRGLTAVDTATATAGLERSRARRAAMDEMRSMLRALVAAESALVADSGSARASPPPAYWSRPMGNNIGPYIRAAFDGWLAWTENTHADGWCGVAVGPDTQWIGNAPSGTPVCFGGNVPRPDVVRIGDEDRRRYLRATGQSQPR